MSKGEIHIGDAIKEKLRNDGQSKKWLAGKIGCCRSNIYKILDRPSIDTSLLQQISIALRKNFFVNLAELTQKNINKLDDTKPKTD